MTEFILVLTQDVIMCAHLKQHLLISMDEVPHSQTALLHWLNRHQVKRVKVILDLQEEELYVDRHPNLFPWEMKAYAERQVHKRFPATDFSRFLYTQSPKLPWQTVSGDIWLSGFNEDDIIQKLINWLEDAEVMVESFHSSMSLLKALLMKTWFNHRSLQQQFNQQTQVLLVRVAAQDFRQLLIVKGHIRTNRQIHIDAKEPDEQMRLLIQEVNLLDKFAKTQKMLDPQATLAIFFLGQDREDSLQASTAFQNSVFAKTSPVKHFTDLQSMIADLTLDQLYQRLLVRSLSSFGLKSDYQPHLVKQVQAIRQASLAVWVLWFTGVVFLLGYVMTFMTQQHEREQANLRLSQVSQAQQSYITRYMTYNDIPILSEFSLSDIKGAMDAQDAIKQMQQQQTIEAMLVPISQVLSRHPSVTLLDVVIEADSVQATNAPKNTTKATQDGRFKRVLLSLVIEVTPSSSLAEKIEQVNRLIADFAQVAPKRFIAANVTKVPFSVDSSQALKFSLEESAKKEQLYIPFEVTLQVGYE